jgi:hypothetical protein
MRIAFVYDKCISAVQEYLRLFIPIVFYFNGLIFSVMVECFQLFCQWSQDKHQILKPFHIKNISVCIMNTNSSGNPIAIVGFYCGAFCALLRLCVYKSIFVRRDNGGARQGLRRRFLKATASIHSSIT